MKKRLLAFTLACAVAFTSFGGFKGPETVKAATTNTDEKDKDVEKEEEKEPVKGMTIDDSIEATFNTQYNVNWVDSKRKVFSHIRVDRAGEIIVNCPSLSNGYVRVDLYDAQKNMILFVADDRYSSTHKVYLPVAAGNYYLELSISEKGPEKSSYSFSFTATDVCEKENNNTKEKATPISVGINYHGYLGSTIKTKELNDDTADIYAVTLKKGHYYRYLSTSSNRPTITQLLGKDTVFRPSVTPSTSAARFCVKQNTVFKAPYTGVYYLRIYNYNGLQYRYDFHIEDLSLSKNAITKIKAGKKSLKVYWKKNGKASGYELQYSTDKKFKKACKKANITSNKATSKTISKLKAKKKYYVRVRSYRKVGSATIYGAWSKVKNSKTK